MSNLNEDKQLQELYTHIEDCFDMATWLEFMLSKDYDIAILEVENDYVYGRLDGVLFRVEMPNPNRIILKTENWGKEYSYVYDKLKSAIAPTVWHLGSKKDKNKDAYRAEVASYKFKDDDADILVSCYDVKNPIELIQELFIQTMNGLIKIYDLEIKYPNFESEEMIHKSLFGKFDGFADKKYIDKIKNFSEFELFINIKTISEACATYYNNVLRKMDKLPEYDEISQKLAYALSYMVQQTERFGVNVNPPSAVFDDQPIEFDAWYYWWSEAYEDLLRQKPNVMEEWKNYKKGFDPKFRPKVPYKDFLNACKELYVEEFQVREAEQLKVQRTKVISTLKEVGKAKKEENKPTINAKQLVNNIISNANQVKQDQTNSPFDFI